ncbi:MAG: GNAT family N-acetyltransferase [Armatimonadetes bacterium]|nr:GNAT family N-acetyltransferase [Armatimonadota bacterium]
MSMEMRQATLDDMPRIQEIVREVWAIGSDFALEEQYGSVGDERWDRWLVPKAMSRLYDELDHVWVTEEDGQVIGFCSYAVSSARKVGTVHYNAVALAGRGKGVGTMQVQKILEIFREAGMEIACVGTGLNEGHAPARRVYEKCGFEPVIEYRMYAQKL